MTPFQQIRQKVLFDILDRFPDHATHSLAKKLYNEHPDMWRTYEDARRSIRYYRGANGDRARKTLTIKKYVKPLRTA